MRDDPLMNRICSNERVQSRRFYDVRPVKSCRLPFARNQPSPRFKCAFKALSCVSRALHPMNMSVRILKRSANRMNAV